MPFSKPTAETLLINLIHDLRQPLSNIEGTAYSLTSLTASADRRIRDQLQLIERQVEEAERLLREVAVQLTASPAQRERVELTNPAS